ncbi:MAG: hypothetical protein A2527_04470 [Candidatus Lambdaproteobacteria bacterium RIFOXYD2_FULL_50_16]|uniref:Transporter n=1 Tax=Candidatus Lambdaproteobacteria bacterium RIFOXYD2_FULL_50_16 TaxID=1817772 RepID=A0A1F6GDQ1_9PROT|nr:MAG: hypothetical protein A2527_04470 [Candidatus Lambdaproteobacteria bacterium RIFOXYD2_FULL_50_16]
MRKASFLFLLLMGLPPFLWAQKLDPELLREFVLVERQGKQVVQVSLKAILKLTLQRAPQLKIASNRTQAAAQVYEASQGMEPITWTNQISQTYSTSPASFLISETGSTSYMSLTATQQRLLSTGLKQKLKSGLSYGLTYQRGISTTSLGSIEQSGGQVGAFTDLTDPVYADAVILGVNLPLFQDLGEVNEVPEKRSGIAAQRAELNAAKERRQILGQVASIYWDLVGISENIKALEKSATLAKQFLEDNRVRESVGAIDPTEVKLAEAQLAMAEKNLLAARIDKKSIEDQIRVVLGLGSLPMEYEPTETLQNHSKPMGSTEALRRIMEQNPEIKIFEEQIKSNDLDLIEAQNKVSTNLDLNLQYRLDGYGYDAGTAGSGVGDPGLAGYQVGLTWSVPLFDHKSEQVLAQAQLEKANAELQLRDAKSQLEVTYGSLLRNLDLGLQTIDLAQTSVELNQQLLEKEQQKFRLGKATSYRVSQVRSDLLDAELSLTLAKIGYEKTYLNLTLLTGEFEKNYEL